MTSGHFLCCNNISIMPLSKSTFTVTLLWVSTFSTPILNHTSLNILNIYLTSLFAMLFRDLLCMLSCYAFAFVGHAVTLQFHYGFFFSILYSGHKIFFFSFSYIFSSTIAFFFLHFAHFTFVSLSSSVSVFLHFHAPKQFPYHAFLSCSPKTNSCSWFSCVLVSLY